MTSHHTPCMSRVGFCQNGIFGCQLCEGVAFTGNAAWISYGNFFFLCLFFFALFSPLFSCRLCWSISCGNAREGGWRRRGAMRVQKRQAAPVHRAALPGLYLWSQTLCKCVAPSRRPYSLSWCVPIYMVGAWIAVQQHCTQIKFSIFRRFLNSFFFRCRPDLLLYVLLCIRSSIVLERRPMCFAAAAAADIYRNEMLA